MHLFFDALPTAATPARSPGPRVAAIGPGTAAALLEHGIRADVVPERFVAEALRRGARGRASSRAGACSSRGPPRRAPCCPTALRERGAQVDDVALYDTVAEPLGDAQRAALERATYVTFTSSSTVRFLLESGVRPPGGRAGRLDRPGHQRDRRASTASRSTWRPSSTTSTASSTPWWPTPRAEGPA